MEMSIALYEFNRASHFRKPPHVKGDDTSIGREKGVNHELFKIRAANTVVFNQISLHHFFVGREQHSQNLDAITDADTRGKQDTVRGAFRKPCVGFKV